MRHPRPKIRIDRLHTIDLLEDGELSPLATTPEPNVYTEIRPVLDRLRTKKATVGDFLAYLKFEMKEIMKVLPPEVQPGARSDGFHAGCCALRSYATLLELEKKVQK